MNSSFQRYKHPWYFRIYYILTNLLINHFYLLKLIRGRRFPLRAICFPAGERRAASSASLRAGSRANTMLVTKALSQDVMVLAFVPLSLSRGSRIALRYNQLKWTYISKNINKKIGLSAKNKPIFS